MDRKLYLAVLIDSGEITIPDNTYEISMGSDHIYFYSKNKDQKNHWGAGTNYIDSQEFDNEQVAYDTYTMEFEGPMEFTLEEFNEWLAANSGAIAHFHEERKQAIADIAGIIKDVQDGISKGLKLAMNSGVPFVVQLEGESFDLRKIKAVDWDSSSMYC